MLKEIMLTGKLALITGGGTGLGLAIAKEMSDSGARVVITGRRKEVLDEALKELPEGCVALQNDITDFSAIPDLVKHIEENIGAIDILVNNAGVQNRRPFLEYELDDVQGIFNTHALAPFMLTQECAKYMKKRGKGVVLMITSLNVPMGMPMLQPYAMAKGGITVLVRSLTNELTPFGIRVNSINPGFTDTEMLRKSNEREPGRIDRILGRCPMKRLAQPKEVAMAAAFLASDAAGYIAGIDLRVDGGISNVF